MKKMKKIMAAAIAMMTFSTAAALQEPLLGSLLTTLLALMV